MTMIERVVRAIDDLLCKQGYNSLANRYSNDLAKTAIQAMREPTEEMIKCHEEVHWNYSCNVCGGLKDGWYKMIDAALKE